MLRHRILISSGNYLICKSCAYSVDLIYCTEVHVHTSRYSRLEHLCIVLSLNASALSYN